MGSWWMFICKQYPAPGLYPSKSVCIQHQTQHHVLVLVLYTDWLGNRPGAGYCLQINFQPPMISWPDWLTWRFNDTLAVWKQRNCVTNSKDQGTSSVYTSKNCFHTIITKRYLGKWKLTIITVESYVVVWVFVQGSGQTILFIFQMTQPVKFCPIFFSTHLTLVSYLSVGNW